MRKETAASFMPDMVQAILDDRKTMTRRKIKNQPTIDPKTGDWYMESFNEVVPIEDWVKTVQNGPCPYGKPGDLLYVREAHYMYGHWEPVEGVRTKGGKQKWKFVQDTKEVLFELTPTKQFRKGRHHKDPHTPAWHKRLARFMPKSAARIWLEVVDIKAERLQNISEADAEAEGANPVQPLHPEKIGKYQLGFMRLWGSINGVESLNANPWVWVVKFKVISKTGKP